ncbi:hypothetical protein CPB83DRAFT_261596 [Crepidotus variabilis]|uniref:Methyltransferase domain-containing protein n=1 Tax=Crepidotus variabilis TaxID=179855 RepID=A0A9P6EIE7_9AGAR|nr:hypothetical protein CPB83DRAFT_261596 [Crepidotus variabilis]
MSSRTAAGRKRLATADDRDKKDKTTSKGFFSKKKNAKAPMDAKAHYMEPSPKQAASTRVHRPDYDYSFQSQYTSGQSYQSQFQNYNSPPSSVSDSQTHYQVSQGQVYFEASYQPPPPSRTHPALQTVSYAKSKAAQSSPTLHSSAEDVVSSFPPPPSYASPNASVYHIPLPNIYPLRPSASPQGPPSLVSSSLSRVSSPAPSELPAYSNSHNDFTTHIPKNSGRITAGDFSQVESQYAPVRAQHQQYLEQWNPPPVPAIPAANQTSYSPNLRVPIPLPSQKSLSLDNSQTDSNDTSILKTDFSPQRRPNVAESIRSVSTKSISSVPATPTPNTFIFPGGRSGGRPKISEKTSNPKINSLHSGRSQGSGGMNHLDATLYDRSASPAPTTSSGGRSIRLALADNLSETHITPAEPYDGYISEKRAGKMPDRGDGTFIHPSSRTKATPHRPPISLKSKSHNSTGAGDHENRRRFLGIPLKTKRKGKDLQFVNTPLASVGLENDASVAPFSPTPISPGRNFTNRIGEYPIDPFDPVVLDNDRRTGELLSFINSNSSPSFFNYGNVPPSTVLDLGCGQGHWMVDAAMAWKGYGTKITGFDMVDLTKGLLPWAVKQGVTENINFVKGNFLAERLPFEDNSFELVRLSCLSMCIALKSWPSVLQEVSRVLMAGGRLELIDDLILFPYAKKFTISDDSTSANRAELPPRLDISVPSARFTTFNVYNHEVINPGLGLPISEKDPSDIYKLYGVKEEEAGEEEGTAIGHVKPSRPLPRPPVPARTQPPDPVPPEISVTSWDRAHSSALDMEAVFDHMLANKFGIQRDVNDFLLEMMIQVFGHARLLKTMHLALPPSEPRKTPTKPSRKTSSRPSSHGPGVVLWPSTFIPMEQTEVDIHASKNLRLLLATRKHLVEHALEATNDDEIDEKTVLDAILEYESFLRHRFTPLPSNTSDRSDAESFSSDYQQDVWEIQSEFREHFAWGDDSGASLQRPANPMSPLDQDSKGSPIIPLSAASRPSNSPVQTRGDRASKSSSPLFPREELTHIRTFRIYEAIKINGSIFTAQN